MKGRTLTAVGVVFFVALIAGILLIILGSTTVVQVVGVALVVIAVLAILAGGPTSSRMAGWARPQMDHDISVMAPGPVADPEPEYISEAPEAPDSVWEHERQLYHEKEEREAHEHEPRGEPQS